MATKFITVSIEIMHDKNLNQSQKFILAEIEQLSQLDDGCYASNKHFSDLIGITKENVSRNINELQKMGYIDIEIKVGSRNNIRIITLAKIVRPPYQNSKTPLLKQQETKENIQYNKTNNIVDDFLNDLKTKVSYKSKVTKTKELTSLIKHLSKSNDLENIKEAYTKHQEDKKEFAVRITKFLEDYETVYKNKSSTNKEVDYLSASSRFIQPTSYKGFE